MNRAFRYIFFQYPRIDTKEKKISKLSVKIGLRLIYRINLYIRQKLKGIQMSIIPMRC